MAVLLTVLLLVRSLGCLRKCEIPLFEDSTCRVISILRLCWFKKSNPSRHVVSTNEVMINECFSLHPASSMSRHNFPYVVIESAVKDFSIILLGSACLVRSKKSVKDLDTSDTALPVSTKNVDSFELHKPLTMICFGDNCFFNLLAATCLRGDRETAALSRPSTSLKCSAEQGDSVGHNCNM